MSKAPLLALLLVVGGGCSPAVDPLPAVLAEAATMQPTEPPPVVVHLKERGTATASVPLRPLRYQFDTTPRRLAIDLKAAGAMRTLHFELALDPIRVEPDGSLRFEFRLVRGAMLDDAAMDPAVVAKYEATLAEVSRLFGTELVTDRGIVQEFGWSVPKNLSLAAHQVLVDTSRVLRELYPPLPEESVGLGATWTTEQENRTRAYTTHRETRWTIAGLASETVDLRASLTEDAARQPFGTKAKNGVQAELASLHGDGSADYHLELTPATSAARASLAMVTRLDVPTGGEPRHLEMSTASETSWGPAGS